jgi:hypothetical protein
MIRAAAIFSVALLAATLGAAQTSSASGAASSQNNDSPSSTTVRGCLSSSSLGDNHFTLTQNQTGTVFTLSGQADQLRSQVGHEVEITGTDISNSNSGNQDNNSGSSSSERQDNSKDPNSTETGKHALKVTGVKMLTDHCTASSVGPSGGPDIPQNTSIHPPQASHREGASMAGQGANGDEIAERSRTSIDALPDDNLPANTRVLPLLGVVGLCSLFAGFVVRR